MGYLLLASASIVFLAYANGANDNFKGVATLFGSKTTSFRNALAWATVTTGLGAVSAVFLAQVLLKTFSGKGLVPDVLLSTPSFPLAVGFAAATTVMLATRFGFPISTTHALTGALVGAGLAGSPSGINFSKLGTAFFLPLIASPGISLVLAAALYPALHAIRLALGVMRQTCVCVGKKVVAVVPAGMSTADALAMYSAVTVPTVTVGTQPSCQVRYQGNFLGIRAGAVIDAVHYLSAGAVCFARGLNDTPKIAAILLIGTSLPPTAAIALVAVFMVLGGLMSSAAVAQTMSKKVTTMNAGQGLTANLVTSLLVTCASNFGLPVSTTHVSCGALFGIGTVTGQADWKVIASILIAWLTTLPLAALLGALCLFLAKCLVG